MPLSQQQTFTPSDLASFIRGRGGNPDDYDLEAGTTAWNAGNVPPEYYQQNQGSSTTQTSALGTAGRAALRSALPVAAGVGAFAPGAAAGAALTAPLAELGGLGPIAGGLISSTLASILASKGQEAGLKAIEGEPSYNEGLNLAQQGAAEHPVASFLGGTAPMLAFGRPSLSGGLRNALKGAAVNATGNVLNQGLEGQDVTSREGLEQTGLAALTGAAFNSPALLGKTKLFGGGPSAKGEQQNPSGNSLSLKQEAPLVEAPVVQSPKVAKPADLETVKPGETIPKDYEEQIDEAHYRLAQQQAVEEAAAKRKALADEIAKQGEQKVAIPPQTQVNAGGDNGPATPGTVTTRGVKGAQQVLEKLTSTPTEQTPGLAEQLQNAMQLNTVPTGETRQVNPQKTNTKGMEKANEENATAPLKPGEDIDEAKFQPAENSNGVLAKDDAFNGWVKQLADKMGVTVQHVLGLTNTEGKPVAGAAYVKSRVAQINPDVAGTDTVPHELGHVFFGDLSASSDPAAKALHNEALRIFGSEEAAVQALGMKHVELFNKYKAQPSLLGNVKQWLSNFWSHVKLSYGGANENDIANLLARQHERMYNKPADVEAFGKLQGKLSGLDISHPNFENDFKNTLGEMEKIKNKYGGEVPKMQEKPGIPNEEDRQNPLKTGTELGKVREVSGGAKDASTKAGEAQEPLKTSIPFIRPVTEEMRIQGEPELARAGEKALEQYNLDKGRFDSTIPTAFKASTHDLEAAERIAQAQMERKEDLSRYAENDTQKKLLTEQRQLSDLVREEHLRRGFHIDGPNGPRDMEKIPFYNPQMLSPKVSTELTNKPNSPTSQQLRADFLQHNITKYGDTPEQAHKLLEQTLSAQSPAKQSLANQSKFGPTRLPEGRTLPASWKEPNMRKNLTRYNQRVAKDFGWRQNFESNPTTARKMGYEQLTTKDPTTNKFTTQDLRETQKGVSPTTSSAAKTFAEYYRGEHTSHEQTANALGRVATAAFLGPSTAIHVLVSTGNKLTEFAHWHEVPQIMGEAMRNLKQGVEHALFNGQARHDVSAVGYEMTNINSNVAEHLSQMAQFITKISGRQHLDILAKGIGQSGSEAIVKLRTIEARQGNKNAIEMLRSLDPKYNFNDPNVLADAPKLGSEVSRMGSLMLQQIHGQYDARSMPAWMLKDGFVAPFFKLASWSLSQTNSFMKNVWAPAERFTKTGGKEGTIEPFLMSTAGAILGGALIKAIREKVTGREGPIPTVNEVFNSSKGYEGNIPIAAYQAMAAASYAGYMGIFSQIGKSMFDIAYKNSPQGAAFPLDETITSLTHTTSNYFQALLNGDGDYLKMTTQAGLDMFKENVQLARVANNWLAKFGASTPQENYKIQTAAKGRNLRAYKEVEGLPYTAQESDESNPYLEINQKLFKEEKDPLKAAQELPSLVQSIYQRFGSNPQVLRSKLEGLKSNSYKTIPSPESEPLTAPRYLDFVRRTQGVGAERELLGDWSRQTLVNRVKASMVP